MKSNHRIRRMQRHNRLRASTVHLNVVSLIDVFAVLVFFLLFSASLAADRLHTLGLDLPSTDQQPPKQEEVKKALEVVIRLDRLEVKDKNGGVSKIPVTAEGHDFVALANRLLAIKKTALKDDQITLLLAPDVPYDTLVQVMDAARTAPDEAVFENGSREMFPLISIGDAAVEGAAP